MKRLGLIFFHIALFWIMGGTGWVSLQAQSLPFPLDTLVSDDHFNNRALARFDGDGHLHIVFTRQLGTQGSTREIYYLTDVSGQWEMTPLTTNGVEDNYATLEIDGQGYLHIGWEARDAAGLFQVYYTNNLGGAFNPPVAITTGGLNKATPYMAVDDSLAHFVYYTFTQGSDNVYYRRYNYLTGILGPEVLLAPGEASSENDAQIDTDSQGKVHLVFRGGGLFSGTLHYFTDAGGTLTEVPTGVTGVIDYPVLTVDATDVVHIVYRNSGDDRLYTINNAGGSFSTPLPITPPNSGLPSFYRNIATDSTGRLYVPYQNSISSAPKGFFLVHGREGVFSEPLLVFEDTTGSYSTRWSSSVAARGNGEVAVVFSPAGLRNGQIIADLLMKRGFLFGPTGLAGEVQPWEEFYLLSNYPNPFNPVTNVEFEIGNPHRGRGGTEWVSLKIYDLLGQEVKALINEPLPAGYHTVQWDGTDSAGRPVGSGVYLYRLTVGNRISLTRKMILLR